MEINNKSKSPPVIHIIYWFVELGFWLFTTVGTVFLILGIVVLLGYEPIPLKVNISLPLHFDLVETGSFTNMEGESPVSIVEANGKVQIKELPQSVMRYFSIGWIGLIMIVFINFRYIRKFVHNIRKGHYFDLTNIGYLRWTSYGIVVLWVYNILSNLLMNQFLLPNLKFDTILFKNDFNFNLGLLIFAAFVWALSIIFLEAARIKTDQDLTV